MPTIQDVISHLESIAPPAYQESYDNAGLIVGNPETEVTGVLVCLDSIESVIEEAIQKKCNLVIAHHPIVFSGLKKINGKNYVERTIIKAIKNDIAIYAIHTNLDNVKDGVNRVISERLGLTDLQVLSPKKDLLKRLVFYCPPEKAESVREALFKVGCGNIGNYYRCSFSMNGTGTFRGSEGSNPVIGKAGQEEKVSEERIEVVFEGFRQSAVVNTLKLAHPYEEVAYSVVPLNNEYQNVGSGMIGRLESPVDEHTFLVQTKQQMGTTSIRHTAFLNKKVSKVAVCGGSGSFLLSDAIRAGADVFITADYKYHQFFDADGRILIADIGHYESEQFTIQLISEVISKNFPTFAVRLTEVSTNPVHYM